MFRIFARSFGWILAVVAILAVNQLFSGFNSGFANTKLVDIAVLIALIGSAAGFISGRKFGVYFFLTLTLIDFNLVLFGLLNNHFPKLGVVVVLVLLIFLSLVFYSLGIHQKTDTYFT